MSEKERSKIYAPHIPAGVIGVRQLKEMAERMEKAGVEKVKLTGELIFVLGKNELSKQDLESLPYKPSQYSVPGVRGIKVCSATTFCTRNQQDVLSLSLELDKLFYGIKLPMKLTVGVAGCHRSCSEPSTKDIGVIAQPDGFKILIGGNAGFNPAIGREFTHLATQEEVIQLVGGIIEFCRIHGRRLARLGKLLDEKGVDFFKKFISENGVRF